MYADYDSIAFETTIVGTADIAVGAPIGGWRTPPNTLDGRYLSYRISQPGTTDWENGFGLFNYAAATIARSNVNVTAGSAGVGTRVSFGAGTKQVLLVVLARDLLRRPKYGGLTGDRVLSSANHVAGATLIHTGGAAVWTCPARIAIGDQLGTETLEVYNRGSGAISFLGSNITLLGPTTLLPGQEATLEWDADGSAAYCTVTTLGQEAINGGALNPGAIQINYVRTLYTPVTQVGPLALALDVGHSTFNGGEASFYLIPNGGALSWNANLVDAATGLNANLPSSLTGVAQRVTVSFDESNGRGLVYFTGRYFTGRSEPQFADILGGPSDNTALGAALSAKADLSTPFQNATGDQAGAAAGRTWKMTGNLTGVPIADGWNALYVNTSGTSKTITPGFGSCIAVEAGATVASVTVANNKAVTVIGDGVNLIVFGDIV